jgi:hypothetical protein
MLLWDDGYNSNKDDGGNSNDWGSHKGEQE